MYLFEKKINLPLDNPEFRQSSPLTNTSMNLKKSTKNEIDHNDDSHYYKEPLDYIPDNNHNYRDRNYSFLQAPKMTSLKSSKFYIYNKSKPVETMVQVDLKNFKISEQRKITENIPKNIKLTNISIPLDEPQKTKRKENKVKRKNNTYYKFDNEILKMPKDNFHSPYKKEKIDIKDKDNIFSVILQSQVKSIKGQDNGHNSQIFIENNEENIKIKTSRNKHPKKRHSPKKGNNQKTESNAIEKFKKDKKEKKLKEIQIIKHENNNSEKSENSSKKRNKKENVNKEITSKKNDVNKQKKPNIVINIIKNDITQKIIIKNELKEKDKTPKNTQNVKTKKKVSNIEQNIDSDNKSKLKPLIVDISPLKKPETDKKKKVYDIIIDKIQGDIDIEKKTSKEKKEKNNIPEINSKEKLLKSEIKNPKDKYNISLSKNNQLSNTINNKIENNISKKNSNDIYPKDKESKNKTKSIIQNITINNMIILKEKNNLRKTFENNKINKNNIKIIKENKENKEIKHKKEKINKKVEEQINFKFIKQIIQRYKDSPVKKLIREKSEIFSKNNKKSSEVIFNKIISSFEKKKELFNRLASSNNTQPLSQNIYTGYHFKPSDFKYIGVLGEGEYGKIYLVQWIKNDNQFYAMKIEKYEYIEEIKNIQNITHVIKDFEEKTNCEGIIKIYGDICLNNNNLYYYYTLMERCERDAEQECILRNKYQKYFTEQNLIDILCQLIITCSSLQKHSICHSDIKPQNILILNGIYKLTDFGEVKIANPKGVIEQEIRGTELYMSPKLFFAMKKKQNIVKHNPYKSDVFSLALCMLLLATFNYDSLVKIRELVDMSKITNIVTGFLSPRYSQNFIAFLMPMLEVDENKRPDFIDLENKLVKNN